MSVKKQLEQLKNIIGIKKVIILEGNVDDIYELEGRYVNVHEYLKTVFNEKNFSDIFIYDTNSGLRGSKMSSLILTNEDKKAASNTSYNEFEELFENNKQTDDSSSEVRKPIDFFKVLNKNLNREDDKTISFIADYTNFFFNEQSMDIEDRFVLTEFSKTLKEFKFVISRIDELTSCVIFITKKINQLPPSFYLDNPEILISTLPKPSREERKQFLSTVKVRISLIDVNEEFENIVDATEG